VSDMELITNAMNTGATCKLSDGMWGILELPTGPVDTLRHVIHEQFTQASILE
jgi:hypothetical protein